MMTVGVQPRPRNYNAISGMYDGKQFHKCRKVVRWSVLNRSSRAGEGERLAGGAEETVTYSCVGAVSPGRWWTKGSRHCGGEGGSAPM